jgi:O-antigen/teichoic acid export membrane protein
VSETLKQKTISGLFWSFIDNFANLGLQFVVGIILARILSPREFGLVGMITIFIAISQTFIDSGFSQALIRKKSCTQADYSTVFYYNLIIGFLFFIVLFASAGKIANFFAEPDLGPIIQVLGLQLIISSLTIIQRTKLTKEINFKLQTKISLIASVCSSVISIVMALSGYGVWSLVIKSLSMYLIISILLWGWNNWKPSWIFSLKSFKDLFSFGSKLLLSSLIETTYKNIYLLIIGKYFSASDLGFYTRANQFKQLPSQNITSILTRVSYPVLSGVQDDKLKLKDGYRRLIRSTMFISFLAMMGMAAIAKPMIVVLVGEKWLPSVEYLQLLCFAGMLYPLHALNLSMLKVIGRSDLFLKIEIIKKMLAIPVIIVGICFGIKIMIIGMIINSFIAYFINSYWSGILVDYSVKEQLLDIMPSFFFGVFISGLVYITSFIFLGAPLSLFIMQLVLGLVLLFLLGEIIKNPDYLYIKNILIEKYKSLKKTKNG